MDLSKLSDEQLEAYRYLVARRQSEERPPSAATGPMESPTTSRIGTKFPEELQPDHNATGTSGSGNEPGLPLIVTNGIKQLVHSIPAFSNSPSRGAADAIEGVGKVASPLALPAAIANPIGTAAGIAGGFGAQKLGQTAAEHFNASPDTSRLIGDVSGIAGGGVASKGITSLGKSVAPALAESSLGIRGKQRQFGAEPGKAALRETSGFDPSKVSESAGDRIGALNPVLEARAEQGNPVPLSGTRGVARDARALQAAQGNLSAYNDLGTLEDSLARNRVTGEEYSAMVPARQAIDIRRGLGQEQGDFNRAPGRTSPATSGARSAYGQLTRDIHEAAPGTAELDQRMSSLIPVRDRAKIAGLNGGATERMVDRATRPTGGLLAPVFGLMHGGIPGLAEAVGLQEGLASPTVKMGLARGLWRGVGGDKLGVPKMPQAPPVRGLLGSGPIVTAPPEDSSFVRGAPGMASPPNAARALPSASVRFTGPAPDQSGVRSVPAQSGFKVGFPQRALPAATPSVENPEIGSSHGDILGTPQTARRPLTMREIREMTQQ